MVGAVNTESGQTEALYEFNLAEMWYRRNCCNKAPVYDSLWDKLTYHGYSGQLEILMRRYYTRLLAIIFACKFDGTKLYSVFFVGISGNVFMFDWFGMFECIYILLYIYIYYFQLTCTFFYYTLAASFVELCCS